MTCLDLTFPTPAENLACDEALLDACEKTGLDQVLRFWEPAEYFVVVGYANEVAREVNLERCAAKNIPIFRRCSGGGTVLQGPGCLNYSLILDATKNPALKTIPQTNRFIMGRNRALLEKFLGQPVTVEGHTDLATRRLKFSGNAQRRKKTSLLFHGTFLLDFEIPLIEACLPIPSHQPDYRQKRAHENFLTNLHRPGEKLKAVLKEGWQARENSSLIAKINPALVKKYNNREWNWKF